MTDRIVVTGGAGFIGSHIVDELVEAGRDVLVVDSFDPAAHSSPPDYLNPGAELVKGDVRDEALMRKLLGGAAAVCHQASKVGLGVDFSDVRDYVDANDAGTASLLSAMHATNFRGRLVLAGSMVVYGEGRYRCAEHGTVRPPPRNAVDLEAGIFDPPCPTCGLPLLVEAVNEDAPVDPRNVYAATKLHQEHLCAAFAREYEISFTALRYHNVYGPRMPRDTPYAGVASIFRSALEAGDTPQVFEDGAQRRDFVHVHDVAHANVIALTADDPRPGTFNIASGDPHTVGELAASLCDAFGEERMPVITGRYRLGDVRHVFASIDRARATLGYEPLTPFTDGMREFAHAPLRSSAQVIARGRA